MMPIRRRSGSFVWRQGCVLRSEVRFVGHSPGVDWARRGFSGTSGARFCNFQMLLLATVAIGAVGIAG